MCEVHRRSDRCSCPSELVADFSLRAQRTELVSSSDNCRLDLPPCPCQCIGYTDVLRCAAFLSRPLAEFATVQSWLMSIIQSSASHKYIAVLRAQSASTVHVVRHFLLRVVVSAFASADDAKRNKRGRKEPGALFSLRSSTPLLCVSSAAILSTLGSDDASPPLKTLNYWSQRFVSNSKVLILT